MDDDLILLRDIWEIEEPTDYKVHFARLDKKGNNREPLEIFASNRTKWQEWQEYWPGRNDFNRSYIFSLMQFDLKTDTWLFGGVFRVLGLQLHKDPYEYKVELMDDGRGFIGRLKLHLRYRHRRTRAKFEKHYENFKVQEILPEPYSGRQFPGYEDIDLPFWELEMLMNKNRPDWRAALESIKGIYLISDTKTGKHYVGAAYGRWGIWSRWREYVDNGHGDNAELCTLVEKYEMDYCRANFRFALLEHRANRTPDDLIQEREGFWKNILGTRGAQGFNRN